MELTQSARDLVCSVAQADADEAQSIYTQEQWRKRGEDYGNGAVLVVVHDGGPFAPYFNWDYCDYEAVERMSSALESLGLFAEQCTCWYSAIYSEVREMEIQKYVAHENKIDWIDAYSILTRAHAECREHEPIPVTVIRVLKWIVDEATPAIMLCADVLCADGRMRVAYGWAEYRGGEYAFAFAY